MVTKSESYYTVSITIKRIDFITIIKDFNLLDFDDKEDFIENLLKELNIKDVSYIANYQTDWKYLEDFIPGESLNIGMELDEDVIDENPNIFDYISLLRDAQNNEDVYFEYIKNYHSSDDITKSTFENADDLYVGVFTNNKDFFWSELDTLGIDEDNILCNYVDYDKFARDKFIDTYNKYNNLIFRQY